jgi:hypothetical protein
VAPALFPGGALASGTLYCDGHYAAGAGCTHQYRPMLNYNNSVRNESGRTACIDAYYGYGNRYGHAWCYGDGVAGVSHLGSASYESAPIGRCWNGSNAGGTLLHCRYES